MTGQLQTGGEALKCQVRNSPRPSLKPGIASWMGGPGSLIGLPERSQVGRRRPSAKSCWTDGRLTLSWKPCFSGQPENVTQGGDGALPAAVTGLGPKAARLLPTPLLGQVTQILWLSISLSVK
ncbi:unnamed protein product [Rangifer tarandus platyrhynchus]|uniref:Uncharacterized protein n=2 Tax=Rangifer tarandus platyrhynchus TaxID=3082113 RepID=A0ABN8ZX49_RANTA|nr:unnamed protein product [Rangifer tarandus platyrhynchus]